jgi:hypothetical protein
MPDEFGNTKDVVSDEHVKRCLELMHLLDGSDYRIMEGVIESGQTTLIFQERHPASDDGFCWEIKMVLRKNRWKLETEKQAIRSIA